MARLPSTFGLESLMLVVALAAACSAVIRADPFLGLLLSVLSAAALVRTSVDVAAARSEGRRMNPFDKTVRFFVSVAIVLTIGVPALVSFVVFTGVCMGCEVNSLLGFVGGIAAAGGAGYGGYRLVVVAIREWQW
ncbi:MAG: hypothetical protein U0835_04895 [Isosphaeraceae bacterium]